MKKTAASALLLLLLLSLALCGCEAKPPSAPATAEQTLPVQTEPGARTPAPGSWLLKWLPAFREALDRCLPLEEGPEIPVNGSRRLESRLRGGVPMLQAETLAELLGCAWEQTGAGTAVLKTEGRELCFRARSMEALADGTAVRLPVPVWAAEEGWYLPAAFTARALGAAAVENEAGLSLWLPEPGPALWFDGVELESLRFGELLCAELSRMAEAAGGRAEAEGDEIAVTVGEYAPVFRGASANYRLEGQTKQLSMPVLPLGEAYYAPAAEFAALIGLPAPTGEGLVWSRMEPRDTLLWVDGRQTQSCAMPEGPLYLRLGALWEPASEETGGNRAVFRARGRELRLEGGSRRLLLDGTELELSAPAYGDGTDWYLPAAETLQALGLTELADPELDQIYYTHIVRHDSLPEGYQVPVLMYHAVSDYLWGIPELFVSPARLEEQLQAIIEGGYTPITFEDLDHVAEIEKPVMLSFDDGYDDNYTELFPLLKQYGVKATVFVIVNDLGKPHKLTEAQVKEMSDSGLVSIQSHTMSHGYLSGMYEKQLRYEHEASLLALARITGKQPFVMCYPTGKSSAYSRGITAEYYQFGLNMTGPCYVTGTDPYMIYRFYIPRNTGLERFRRYLAGG
ncbi:MAG: polysaccharide deacetylase family protein [Oscillospiraceae bacterium]|nr:polysaccharide deacetylase family protein [Oscillospiraceae bacterium]